MKVLSIDFDFFQRVDKSTVKTCYPDGIDLPTDLSTIVWSSIYANPFSEERVRAVNINDDETNEMKSLIERQSSSCKVLITNSHKHIYDFIGEGMSSGLFDNNDKLWVTHIDMHDDMFNDNPELDCGNWVQHVFNTYDTALEWIANPISRTVYGLEGEQFDFIKTSIKDTRMKKFDYVFMCRSDNWLPPHLDVYFDEMVYLFKSHFDSVTIENSVAAPRNFETGVSNLKGVYEELSPFLEKNQKHYRKKVQNEQER